MNIRKVMNRTVFDGYIRVTLLVFCIIIAFLIGVIIAIGFAIKELSVGHSDDQSSSAAINSAKYDGTNQAFEMPSSSPPTPAGTNAVSFGKHNDSPATKRRISAPVADPSPAAVPGFYLFPVDAAPLKKPRNRRQDNPAKEPIAEDITEESEKSYEGDLIASGQSPPGEPINVKGAEKQASEKCI